MTDCAIRKGALTLVAMVAKKTKQATGAPHPTRSPAQLRARVPSYAEMRERGYARLEAWITEKQKEKLQAAAAENDQTVPDFLSDWIDSL